MLLDAEQEGRQRLSHKCGALLLLKRGGGMPRIGGGRLDLKSIEIVGVGHFYHKITVS